MNESRLSRFYRELKRRKVIRVALTYAIVAWLLVEIASVVFPELLLPDWSVRLVIALLIVGFPVALVLAWAFDLSPDGIRPESGPPVPDTEPEPEVVAETTGRAASEFRSTTRFR